MINRPEIGSDILWIDVVGHVFRVLEFDRAGTTIGAGDTVKAKSRFKPYGYLLVESPIFNQPAKLPIVHRDDFILAATVFDEPHLADLVTEEELLVTYVPKRHLPTGHALGPSHALHYVIVPRGTLDQYYDTDAHLIAPLNQVFGELVYEGEIRVQVNSEPFPAENREVSINDTEPEVLAKAMEIIKGFGKFLSESQPIIPDAQLLPYPKSKIAQSLLMYERCLCEVANEHNGSHDSERLKEIEGTLGPVRACRGLVAAYSDIDPQDVKAVAYFNSFKAIGDVPKDEVEECLDLQLKYASKGMEEETPG